TLLIKQGAVQSVTIIAQQNIADALYTVVQNNRLKIYTDKWLTTDKDIVYEIVVPQITGMELAGSGKFKTTETIKTSKLDITVSGSGQMEVDVVTNELECDIMGSGNIAIKGSSNKTDLEISGSGAYHGFECYTANCDASISGSGLAEVSVSNSLKASVSGSGVINYTGKPKDVKKSISGSGAVNALN
ncbi:MAG TPA: head GIN domain-containing protein, partial [Bacteroidia bacterium]|nr:head GIN domain-containing protein [Bacteroidia bacterium]